MRRLVIALTFTASLFASASPSLAIIGDDGMYELLPPNVQAAIEAQFLPYVEDLGSARIRILPMSNGTMCGMMSSKTKNGWVAGYGLFAMTWEPPFFFYIQSKEDAKWVQDKAMRAQRLCSNEGLLVHPSQFKIKANPSANPNLEELALAVKLRAQLEQSLLERKAEEVWRDVKASTLEDLGQVVAWILMILLVGQSVRSYVHGRKRRLQEKGDAMRDIN